MGGLIKIVFPLVGYLCVATVITLAGGYGYLRNNGTLDDENMFQIISLIHGIDLQQIADTNQTDSQDVPGEEMSFEARRKFMMMKALHLQTMKDDIKKNIEIFRGEFSKLTNQFHHFETIRKEVKELLENQKKDRDAQGLTGVVAQLKGMDPRKQSKPLLMKYIANGQMDVVIKLLKSLPPAIRGEILNTFDNGPKDVDTLYELQQRMLKGDPKAATFDKKLQELKQQQN